MKKKTTKRPAPTSFRENPDDRNIIDNILTLHPEMQKKRSAAIRFALNMWWRDNAFVK